MENDRGPRSDKTTPQNEVALNVLRDQAVNNLLKQGRESAYTSTASPTAHGLKIETADDKTQAKTEMTVEAGKPSVSFQLFPPGQTESTDVKVTKGKDVETGQIEFSYKEFDRDDKGHVNLKRTDSSGHVIQTAIGDYDKYGHNHTANNTTEVDYKINDAKLGELYFNQVVTAQPNGSEEYRSVIRDKQNRVLGVVDQNFTRDANGNLKTVRTEARKSQYQGQIVPPTE